MQAAVPHYLQNHLGEAAPGHYFGLYYAGWNDNLTPDRDGKIKAKEIEVAGKKKSASVENLKATVCPLPKHSRELLKNLVDRQQHLAASLQHLFTWPALATAPFATGLGNEHPLENGFAFLPPYGLPYLPGSGIKGVLRRAAEELASGEWGDDQGWSEATIANLFGPGEDDPTRDSDPRQGALRFWDVYPQPAASLKDDRLLLGVEIMTPHLGDYYQGKATPNTSLSPNPIPFLAVLPGSRFCFHVEYHPGRIVPELAATLQTLLAAAFAHAGEWLGFGAKTTVGYGRMARDEKRAAEQRERQAAEEKRQQEDRAKAEEVQRLALMSPFERSLAEVIQAKPADQSELKALFNALKNNRWQGEDAARVAERLKTMMQASGQWREKSEKKKPEKDEPYQMTLSIKARLSA